MITVNECTICGFRMFEVNLVKICRNCKREDTCRIIKLEPATDKVKHFTPMPDVNIEVKKRSRT